MYGVAWCGSTAPSYLAVTCLMLVSPEEYNTWTFLGDDFQMDAVFSSLLGSTVDTCFCQSTRRSRSGLVPGSSLAWFDSEYIFASVYEGLFLLFPYTAQCLSSVVHAMHQSWIWFGGRCPCCAGRVPCPLLCSTSPHGSDPAEFRGDAAVAVSSRLWRSCVHAARCSVLSRIRVRGSCWTFFAPQAVFAVGADFEWLHVDLLRVARCPRYVGAESLG